MSRGLGELTVMHGEVAVQHGLRLSFGLGSRQPQLTDEAVLKSSLQSLDAPLGLGRSSQNKVYPEFF
jgi:hypothetical protein